MEPLHETVEAMREKPQLGKCTFFARNKWVGGCRNQTAISEYYCCEQRWSHPETFRLDCDEPLSLGGEQSAPNPVEHLLNALAGCLTTALVAHAAVRGIHLEEVESELEGDIDLRGFLGLDPRAPKGYTSIRVKFRVKGDQRDAEQLKKLAEFSPVYNTLIHSTHVDLDIETL